MAYPVFYPFKTRVLNASSSSSNGFQQVAVPARSKYVAGYYAPTSATAHTATVNTCEVILWPVQLTNNTTPTIVSSGTGCAVTTTTGTAGTQIPITSSITVYCNPGDILATQLSSCVGGTMSFVLQEF